MKPIRVRFFASLREQIGREFLEFQAADTPDIATLWECLQQQLPGPAINALRARGIKIAVNQDLVEGNVQLSPGDEIAFLPPVTGG